MGKDNNHEHLNTLKEMILDERKLVTYVSLSKEMCLHVNESKSLLSQLVKDLKKSNTDTELNVNIIISGLLEGNKAQTLVCNESELTAAKNKFKTVFYEHVYSVSLGTPSTENISFMAINKFEDFPLCTGLIKSNSCVKRSSDEIGSLKTNSQEILSREQKQSVLIQKKAKEMNHSVSEYKPVMKALEKKTEPVIKSEVTSPKKDSKNTLQKTEHKSTKGHKGIAGFFNKPAASNKKNNSTSETTPKVNIINNGTSETTQKIYIKQEKLDNINNSKIKTEEMDVDEGIPKKEVFEKSNKNLPQSDKKENKSLNEIKKTAKVDKKRKRVLHVSDSESEDEKNDPFKEEPSMDQESEDEIPSTPLVNTVKITSGITNPKKRRKVVDKTYTDEDGYILTKKEEVYESCSENEEEGHLKENIQQVNKVKVEVSPPEKKKNGIKNVKKKMASPQKGKQATLMSFFKKV